jgi:hypothetical protein
MPTVRVPRPESGDSIPIYRPDWKPVTELSCEVMHSAVMEGKALRIGYYEMPEGVVWEARPVEPAPVSGAGEGASALAAVRLYRG